MPLSKRLLYSSLLAFGLVILLVAGSVSALTAYGYSNNSHNQERQTGWSVRVQAATGPSDFASPLQINGMFVMGSCTLTRSTDGGLTGNSGYCHFLGMVNAQGMPVSVCEANIPVSFWTQVPVGPEAPLSAVSGKPDLRIFSNGFTLQGSHTGLCSAILFDGNSADLFVPAAAGHYNFAGDPTPFGTFLEYYAVVHAIYSHGHNDN
jgi:hypothetical protein